MFTPAYTHTNTSHTRGIRISHKRTQHKSGTSSPWRVSTRKHKWLRHCSADTKTTTGRFETARANTRAPNSTGESDTGPAHTTIQMKMARRTTSMETRAHSPFACRVCRTSIRAHFASWITDDIQMWRLNVAFFKL